MDHHHEQPMSSPGTSQQQQQPQSSENIQHLIQYARTNYQQNPTESLACLLQAMDLNTGPGSSNAALSRLRNELGDDIAEHVGNTDARMRRALTIMEELLQDESTFLYQQGNQRYLQQSMEDGSSVVCRHCKDVVSSARWQQHQQYWCRMIVQDQDEETSDDNDSDYQDAQQYLDALGVEDMKMDDDGGL